MRYSKRVKESVLRKVLPPESRSVPEVAQEMGISEQTIYNWKRMVHEPVSKLTGWTIIFFFQLLVRMLLNVFEGRIYQMRFLLKRRESLYQVELVSLGAMPPFPPFAIKDTFDAGKSTRDNYNNR